MIHYLADTNILGYFVRASHPPLQARMHAALQREEVAISVITRAETRYGLARLNANDKRRQSVALLLASLPALPWSPEAADCYGDIAARLEQSGLSIGIMDTLIAAHALTSNLIVVTHNTRHFERIAGLKIEDWTV